MRTAFPNVSATAGSQSAPLDFAQKGAGEPKLDAVQKAQLAWAIISVFLLIVLLGAIILIVGRYSRRQVRSPLPSAKPQQPWYSKPLVPSADDAATGDEQRSS